MSRITKRYCTVKALDGGTFSQTFADVGDFKADALQQGGAAAVPIIERDLFVGYVFGPQEAVTGSFTVNVPRAAITDATTPSPLDILLGTGAAASHTTTNDGGFGPAAYTLDYTIAMGGLGGRLRLTKVRFKGSYDESGDTAKYSITFTGYGLTATA